jgi:hypothetical protein
LHSVALVIHLRINKHDQGQIMAGVANQAHNEFWRPPASGIVVGQAPSETCDECRTEFIVGSRYCHCCGASRPQINVERVVEIPGWTEFTSLGERLGLTTPSLIAFLIGALCLVGVVAVGVLFTARTALDWQAIQLWRIEWLLGAIAGFAAGTLLKKNA